MFSVLVASMLLAIGVSIANITTQESVLSSTSRESQFAFYAADSGIECALYFDQPPRSSFSPAQAGSITCNGETTTTGSQNVATSPPSKSKIGGGADANPNSLFQLNWNGSDPKPYCAVVSVIKTPLGSGKYKTTIESRGRSNCVDPTSKTRVERGIRVQY